MHVDKFENAFLWLAGLMMAMFAGAIAISVGGLGIHLPGDSGQIDPAKIGEDRDFSNPGLREVRPGVYEAFMDVQMWAFFPVDMEVPAGSTVTFFLTSHDVTHGFMVQDTTINIMVIPGQISRVTYTFNRPGTYPFMCQEYCGQRHHLMTGTITVTENK